MAPYDSMKIPSKIPAVLILTVGFVSIPLAIASLTIAFLVTSPQGGERETVFDSFPLPILIAVLFSTLMTGGALIASIVRRAPLRWWSAAILCMATALLSVLGLYCLLLVNEPLPKEKHWADETLGILTIGSQLVVGSAIAVVGIARIASR